MKKYKVSLVAVAIATSALLFNSCVGSFSLFNKVLTWNKGQGKLLGEVLYLVMWILPVYDIALGLDFLIFNTIEFWTGKKMFSMKVNEKIDKFVKVDGKLIKVEYSYRKVVIEDLASQNKKFELYFDKDNNCYLTSNNITTKIGEYMKDVNDNLVYLNVVLPGGGIIKLDKKMNISNTNMLTCNQVLTKQIVF